MAMRLTAAIAEGGLSAKVNELSGDDVNRCLQCGTCAGICPLVLEMELSPREVMVYLTLGCHEEVRRANTAWVCASCQNCLVECPQDIDVPAVMEAIRQIALRAGEEHLEPIGIAAAMPADVPTIAMVAALRKHTS